MGAKAVDLILDGQTEKMVGFTDNQIKVFDLDEAIKQKKSISKEDLELAQIMASV
jgi:6-phosphofructokinase 1